MAITASSFLNQTQADHAERWEMESLEHGSNKPGHSPQRKQTDESRRAALAQGFEQGYAEGIKQGRQDGERAVRQETQQRADSEIHQIQQLVAATEAAVDALQEKIAQEVMKLAIDLTRQIITQEITQNPQVILAITREAITHISNHEKPAQIVVHPHDAETLRHYMRDELAFAGCKILEDIRIERGGCKIISNSGELDSQVSTRWKRVIATLTGGIEKVPSLNDETAP